MIELKNLDTEELECNELRVNSLTCESINGITKDEINCLKGVKSNIQEQIDDLNDGFDDLIAAWQ